MGKSLLADSYAYGVHLEVVEVGHSPGSAHLHPFLPKKFESLAHKNCVHTTREYGRRGMSESKAMERIDRAAHQRTLHGGWLLWFSFFFCHMSMAL